MASRADSGGLVTSAPDRSVGKGETGELFLRAFPGVKKEFVVAPGESSWLIGKMAAVDEEDNDIEGVMVEEEEEEGVKWVDAMEPCEELPPATDEREEPLRPAEGDLEMVRNLVPILVQIVVPVSEVLGDAEGEPDGEPFEGTGEEGELLLPSALGRCRLLSGYTNSSFLMLS